MRLQADELVDGRYKLIERIGSGGMADVWRARDSELDRDVALKILHENFARDKEFVERFRREASSAAGLQHPNVVSVFDRGTYEDTYFIAMECVEGSSLRDLINRGLETSEAIEVTRQILAAAQFAHERGIVHRDLKPLNVLIDRSGRIRVTDFGIARAGNSEITQTGSVMGTSQYLSPEQAQGMDVTPAADIYSVGIMLFEMLTGRVPFDGDNAVAIAMKQVGEIPPAPSSINPAISPALDAVVLRALEKDPADRFASAAEMSAALDAAEANPEQGGHTERFAAMVAEEEGDHDRRWWWIGALLALLLIGGALAYFLTRPDMVEVPSVVSKSGAQATIELQGAGFEVDVEERELDQPEGQVVEQDPRGGTEAEKGSTVTIFVSSGPGTVAVPRLAGETVTEAKKQLKDLGFVAEVSKQSSGGVRAGRVIGTDPTAATNLATGESVTLIVSTGVATESVPNVVGMSRAEAVSALRGAGFLVNQDSADSDEAEDQVLSQDPGGGASVPKGSVVNIVYSSGVGTVTLDNFVGQKVDYAQRKLESAGLSVTIVSQDVTDASDDGIVVGEAPSPGTRLSPGDRVSLTVGQFTEPPAEEPTTTTSTTTTSTTTTPDPAP
ncbi:MAG: PASTA domain-containing protein [Solirubrobacterales bacterium]